MVIQEGTYHLTASSGKVFVSTYKEGFLSAVAHDLLIEVTSFSVKLQVPAGGIRFASVEAEIQANDGHNRQQGITEGMPEHHVSFSESFGACRTDVILVQRFQQRRARHTGDNGQRDGADGDGRQDHVAERIPE